MACCSAPVGAAVAAVCAVALVYEAVAADAALVVLAACVAAGTVALIEQELEPAAVQPEVVAPVVGVPAAYGERLVEALAGSSGG